MSSSTLSSTIGCKMEERKANVLKRLEQRELERTKRIQERRIKYEETADPNESIDKFWKEYNELKKSIRTEIQETVATFQKETRKQRRQRMKDDPENDPVLCKIKEIYRDIASLQQIVTSASLFLAKYDVRSAQEGVATLENELSAAKDKLRPPKKFSFSTGLKRHQRGHASAKAAERLKKIQEQKKSSEGITKEKASAESERGLVVKNRSECAIRLPQATDETKDEEGGDLTLRDLDDCTVGVCKRMSTVRLVNLRSCRVYCGPIDGSVFIDECVGCRVVLAARQVRIHNTTDCTFEVHTNSGPIIEDCTRLRFGPYPNLSYEGSVADFEGSTLGAVRDEGGKWRDVKDFKWHRTQASPNWTLLEATERSTSVHRSSELNMRIDVTCVEMKRESMSSATRKEKIPPEEEEEEEDSDDEEEL